MGIANYLIAASLKLIIAQRLLRKLCPHCKQQVDTPLVLPETDPPKRIRHWLARGCDHCVGGYYQRTGVYELLPITETVQQQLLLQSNLSLNALRQLNQQQNINSLYQAGLALVAEGITSYAELCRVLDNVPSYSATPVSNSIPNAAATPIASDTYADI